MNEVKKVVIVQNDDSKINRKENTFSKGNFFAEVNDRGELDFYATTDVIISGEPMKFYSYIDLEKFKQFKSQVKELCEKEGNRYAEHK